MTNSKKLEGVFAPVVTTFRASDEEFDGAAFAANAQAHMAAGLHGIVVTGSTGEAALLDQDERSALVDAARAAVPKDRWLIVGTGAESTRTCLKQTKDAAKRGADAVLVVAPHYYATAMTEAALRQHYQRVADESPVPVILYSIPKYMHFSLPESLVAELAQHENVIGIKDSSGNREALLGFMKSSSPTFAVLVGNAQLFQHSLRIGATGGILAAAMFAPTLALEIYGGQRGGDPAAAEAAQTRFSPLGAKIVGDLGVAGVKAALDKVGLAGGVPRSPLLPLTETQLAVVEELLGRPELVGV